MDFIAYRFDCWPIELETLENGLQLDKVDGKTNFEKRIDIINGFFDEGERRYLLGDGSRPLFKQGNELVLRRYRTKRLSPEDAAEENAERQRQGLITDEEAIPSEQMVVKSKSKADEKELITESEVKKLPKSEQDTTYVGRIVYHHDGVTVLRVQKKRELKGENKDFRQVVYSENDARSMVVMVVRDGLQYVFIEAVRRAFAPATLSYIVESTLNRLLMVEYNVMVQVKPVRRLDDFWKVIMDKQLSGVGLKRLHFKFDYPNMPWPDDLLGGRFKRLGMDLNAEADIILKGQHGQPLRINTKSGERNKDINSMARYSCDRGNGLDAVFTDNSATNFGYRQTGDVTLSLNEELKRLQGDQEQVFPEYLSEDIILKANTVKSMNDGCI